MLADSELRLAEPLEGDVDGDGTDDAVSIYMDPDAEVGCQAFLVVEAGGAPAATPVWRMGEAAGLPEPTIHSFADVDGLPGAEVVLLETAGASTQFVGVYSFDGGELHALEAPRSEFGLFPYGGSVGHIEAVDCTDDDVVVSQAVPSDAPDALEEHLYTVTRRFYEPTGTGFRRTTVERREIPIGELEEFPEFGAPPFGSCPAAP